MTDKNLCNVVKSSENVERDLSDAISKNYIGREIIRFRAAIGGQTLGELERDMANDLIEKCHIKDEEISPSQTPKQPVNTVRSIQH